MLYRVLKAFPYAADGMTIEQLAVGDESTIVAALVPGLVAEGYIAVTDGSAPPPPVKSAAGPATAEAGAGSSGSTAPGPEIPEDWQKMPWIKLQALVRALSGKQPKDKNAAIEAVEAAIAARTAG